MPQRLEVVSLMECMKHNRTAMNLGMFRIAQENLLLMYFSWILIKHGGLMVNLICVGS